MIRSRLARTSEVNPCTRQSVKPCALALCTMALAFALVDRAIAGETGAEVPSAAPARPPAQRSSATLPRPAPVPAQASQPVAPPAATSTPTPVAKLDELVAEALRANPEIAAARRERDAAQARIAPAGALDDPMLEAGIVNLPIPSYSLNREDMTMKMLGLSQRLPYPGKRELRRTAAEKDAQSIEYALRETSNRVMRDVKVAYYDLSFVLEAARLVQKNRLILEQFAQLAQGRYAVGQASQSDVLKAQTQLSRMLDELIRLGGERAKMEADLKGAIGRPGDPRPLTVESVALSETALSLPALSDQGLNERPQLRALQSKAEQAGKLLDLARKDYYPDFDLRFAYGLRDSMPNGNSRDNMISFTVAINLPIWRETKLAPRVTEAVAMQGQALEMLSAQRNELKTQLAQQVAMAEQSYKSARLYDTTVLPQARLAVEAALAAYRVTRVDFLTLLDSQMTVLNYEISRAQTVVSFNKALAQIEFLTGAAKH